MGARFLIANGLVLGGIAWMTTFAGMEVRAAEVLPHKAAAGHADQGAELPARETRAALSPTSPAPVAALAGASLARAQPGLATAVIEKSPRQVRERPEVAHLYARALFHRGQARE